MSLSPTHEVEPDPESPGGSGSGSSKNDRNGSDAETLRGDDVGIEDEKKKKQLPEDLKDDLEKREPNSDEIDESSGTLTKLAKGTKRVLHLDKIRATGPGRIFNPTNARFRLRWENEDDSSGDAATASEKPLGEQNTGDQWDLRWSSRYNRKGRNSFVMSRSGSMEQETSAQRNKRRKSNTIRILKNILRMFTTFPYWDMAFWSGWSYSVGSVLFILDGAFAWTPLAWPNTKFAGEEDLVGYLYFFGSMFYELGALVAYFEAINDGSFHGSAMKRFVEGKDKEQKRLLDQKLGAFFGHLVPHSSKKKKKMKRRRVTRPTQTLDIEAGWWQDHDLDHSDSKSHYIPEGRRDAVDFGTAEDSEEGHVVEYLPWRWWPTWDNLKNHHIKELGFWACVIQLLGATLYWEAGIVALPFVIDKLSQWQENAAYWIPQIVASACFLTAGIFFTVETQEKWWKPEPSILGWWIGAWATVGATGFLLAGVLGPAYGNHGAQYEDALSSTWGSFAYMISGLLQWYEAINKNPIAELFSEPGHLKSFQVRF